MNANDLFKDYNCTDHYYKHMKSIVYTDGVRALCAKFKCYWFLDIIVSYQGTLKDEEFQVWKLERTDSNALVTCGDGNGNIFVGQKIEYTDFEADTATFWLENNVILLPSEH